MNLKLNTTTIVLITLLWELFFFYLKLYQICLNTNSTQAFKTSGSKEHRNNFTLERL